MDMTLSGLEEASPAEGGGFVACAEQLPGAISEGNTLEQARENLRDAIALRLEADCEPAAKEALEKRLRPYPEDLISLGTERLHFAARRRTPDVFYNRVARRTSPVPRHREIKNPTVRISNN